MKAPTPGLCAWCGEPIVGSKRSTRKYCDDACRHAFHAEKAKADRATKARKVCSCNGSRVTGYDEDGSPTCQTCGAPIEGLRRRSGLRKLDYFAALMDVPLYRKTHTERGPWPDRRDTGLSTAVRVYSGAPFEPRTEVEIVPASTFQSKGRR